METSSQFETVLRLPHRRHAFGVNAPGLFRHIGFRIEIAHQNPLTAAKMSTSNDRRNNLIIKLNETLADLQRQRATKDVYSFCLHTEAPRLHRLLISETLLIELNIFPEELANRPELAGWRLRFRLDMYDEYYFVTLILDQKTPGLNATGICDVEQRLSADRQQLGLEETEKFLEAHYAALWTAVDGLIGETLQRLPGSRFTEFRGIALRELTNPLRQPDAAADTHKIAKSNVPLIQESSDFLRTWITRNAEFVSEVLQLNEWAGRAEQDANCVLSELLGGCAIYFSSVRLTHMPSVPTEPLPLRYFILYNGLSKYQLGRLRRRTHVLGELRCAAVLDMDLLDEASTAIRSLGNRIDELLAHGKKTLTESELGSLQAELNRIAFSEIPGGLIYRVNRSRFYASTFLQRIKEMRVQQLEGWQSYSEFFHRNLYPHFEQIDQIGQRYETLAERINLLTNARNAEKLNEFETNSLNLVGQMNTFNAAMVRIQDLGEWIGVTAFTYYGGHIIGTLARQGPGMLGLCSRLEDLVGQNCARLEQSDEENFFFVGMILAFVVAIIVRQWWHHKK
jgi:hypothetical protein